MGNRNTTQKSHEKEDIQSQHLVNHFQTLKKISFAIYHFSINISVFDLSTFQFIKQDALLTKNNIQYHCFVSKSENEQEMMKINKQNYQLLLFCKNTGLSIKYDEDNNTFQFHQLPVCEDIVPLCKYACVYQ
ncbi:hypothetical protein RFI_04140 [Reticulomyxa filosa]|uniref:Uncharacterized protein n=1 Tax=Reticulomyxa filosa TaxID=46433 RepID=X6P436_RETFI|nr:hypothetical protein RFI_04140 [Reticulomyxa filosa]|eukprot:ETO32966.1 hypothetical protein RFI_04140 [Reticulomyxa filosa]